MKYHAREKKIQNYSGTLNAPQEPSLHLMRLKTLKEREYKILGVRRALKNLARIGIHLLSVLSRGLNSLTFSSLRRRSCDGPLVLYKPVPYLVL